MANIPRTLCCASNYSSFLGDGRDGRGAIAYTNPTVLAANAEAAASKKRADSYIALKNKFAAAGNNWPGIASEANSLAQAWYTVPEGTASNEKIWLGGAIKAAWDVLRNYLKQVSTELNVSASSLNPAEVQNALTNAVSLKSQLESTVHKNILTWNIANLGNVFDLTINPVIANLQNHLNQLNAEAKTAAKETQGITAATYGQTKAIVDSGYNPFKMASEVQTTGGMGLALPITLAAAGLGAFLLLKG